MLQRLVELGMTVNFSCEQGTCGACEIKVIEGVPDHSDAILTDVERAANNAMMICCSRWLFIDRFTRAAALAGLFHDGPHGRDLRGDPCDLRLFETCEKCFC
jgi:2Fe-2S iron-sulfur cluster binding domain